MRKILYAGLFLLFIAVVLFQAHRITEVEKAEVPSITAEWKNYGLPVDVARVIRSSMVFITKVSGRIKTDGIIEAEVPWETLQELSIGQRFTSCKYEQHIQGIVKNIAEERNIATGLYRVEFIIKNTVRLSPGTIIVACVETKEINNVLTVLKAALQKEDSKDFCWAVNDNTVTKRFVTLGRINTEKVEILQGLKEGDLVVIEGARALSEEARVRIRNTLGELP